MGMKSAGGGAGGGGEIIQVQGGHIVRSTGRKDRHSKVYTAKGPRDRRVRLSAHTAIQFYDVQDRLGYDRPSKAVDWLIKKAKSSIDKLAELPPWHPITGVAANNAEPDQSNPNEMVIGGGAEETESSGYNFHQLQRQMGENNNNQANNVSSFNIPPSLDSDTIADTMKSFFPTSSAATSSINFQSYPADPDLISRTTNLNPCQDLGLSLHSFQDQGLNIHHTHSQQSQGDTNHNNDQIQTLFAAGAGGSTVGFDTSYQRMVAWSNQNRGGDGGFVFNSHSQALPQQAYAHAQGGTLQSSFSPSVSARAWNDSSIFGTQQRTQQQQQQPMIHHSSILGTRFASDGGLPVFCIPTRINAEEADNGGVSDRPSSTSSPNSTHH